MSTFSTTEMQRKKSGPREKLERNGGGGAAPEPDVEPKVGQLGYESLFQYGIALSYIYALDVE